MTANQFIERAIRVPFFDKGRNWDGWDCWGLVVCYYQDVLKLELPSYGDYDSVRSHRTISSTFQTAVAADTWNRADTPNDGHVAVIYRRGLPLHAGVAICRGSRILHCEERVGTIHEPLSRFRTEGFYQFASQL